MLTNIISFFKKNKICSLVIGIKEKKRATRLAYLIFISENNLTNNIKLYREYRSGYRAHYGFDIAKQRPFKKIDPIEMQRNLFKEKD